MLRSIFRQQDPIRDAEARIDQWRRDAALAYAEIYSEAMSMPEVIRPAVDALKQGGYSLEIMGLAIEHPEEIHYCMEALSDMNIPEALVDIVDQIPEIAQIAQRKLEKMLVWSPDIRSVNRALDRLRETHADLLEKPDVSTTFA